jgi:outer membrane immunogenic protein
MMSKRIVLIAAAAGTFIGLGAASAADLPARYAKAPIAPPVVTYNWTGCYIGGNVGGGWARTSQTQVGKVSGPFVGVVLNNDFGAGEDSNVIGGVQVGCDYQFAGNWVVGVQGMFDFGDISSRHNLTAFPGFYSIDRTKEIFTGTARLGYLFTPAVLGYVKGGGAWARTDSAIRGTVPADFLAETASADRSGWTVGGGLEWMFAPGWSVFGEYNYMDFGRRDVRYVLAPFPAVGDADVVSTRLTVQQVLVGVNYKFNFGGPVVAKY